MTRKAENAELSNSIESKNETPEKGLEQVGRNDPSDLVSEETTKKVWTNRNICRIFLGSRPSADRIC